MMPDRVINGAYQNPSKKFGYIRVWQLVKRLQHCMDSEVNLHFISSGNWLGFAQGY